MPTQQQLEVKRNKIYILLSAIVIAAVHLAIKYVVAGGFGHSLITTDFIFWLIDSALIITFIYFSIHDIANKGNADATAIAMVFISALASIAWALFNFHG